MLGFVALIVCLIGLAVGLEMSSPGTLAAMVEAGVRVWFAVNGQVDVQICDQLNRLSQISPACQAG